MNREQTRQLSQKLLEQERSQAGISQETTPLKIGDDLLSFGMELVGSPPVFVPVVEDHCGLYGWCRDGVIQKVEMAGGRPVFGWTIWEWPLVMWTAEFHCVWQSPEEDFIDITPKPSGETKIVFVPDFSVEAGFNFDSRPTNRRKRIWPDRDDGALVEALESSLSSSQRIYEERRAARAGFALSEWLRRKTPRDPVPQLIDRAINACAEHEDYLDRLHPGGGMFEPDEKLLRLMKVRYSALNVLRLALRS